MNNFEAQRYSDEECVDAFHELFPRGFAAEDVIAEIAPDGWDRSPLVAIFHPSLEQVFRKEVVYEMTFKRLCGRQLDWVYHFPRLNLIDLQPLRESLQPDDEPDWVDYSPESALAKEREDQDRQQRSAKWCDAMSRADRGGFICERELRSMREQFTS